MKRIILSLFALFAFAISANAACPAGTYYTTDNTNCIFVSPTSPLPVVLNPSNVITGNATGTTDAVVATLAGTTGKTTYLCGFDVSAIGGTAAVGPITIANLTGSSMVYQLASSASGNTLSRTFMPCIPANAANTSITITTTADGTASGVSVNSWGYQQ